MTRKHRLSVALAAGLTVLAMPSAAAAQGDSPHDGYWYCYSLPGDDPIYITPVWAASAVPDDVQTAFKKMLTEKYNYQHQVLCSYADKSARENTLEKTQADAKAMFGFYEKQGKRIVQTGWTNPTGTAPPAPVTWGLCRAIVVLPGGTVSNGPFEIYLSDAFSASYSASLSREAREAFKTFVASKYGVNGANVNPACEVVESEATALNGLRVWALDATRRRSKLIQTGWTFAGG